MAPRAGIEIRFQRGGNWTHSRLGQTNRRRVEKIRSCLSESVFDGVRCGAKDAQLFESVMRTVAAYLEQSDDLTFLSDGERRYGNTLFDLCAEVLREGLLSPSA